MRSSDCSSDVCSSDLDRLARDQRGRESDLDGEAKREPGHRLAQHQHEPLDRGQAIGGECEVGDGGGGNADRQSTEERRVGYGGVRRSSPRLSAHLLKNKYISKTIIYYTPYYHT